MSFQRFEVVDGTFFWHGHESNCCSVVVNKRNHCDWAMSSPLQVDPDKQHEEDDGAIGRRMMIHTHNSVGYLHYRGPIPTLIKEKVGEPVYRLVYGYGCEVNFGILRDNNYCPSCHYYKTFGLAERLLATATINFHGACGTGGDNVEKHRRIKRYTTCGHSAEEFDSDVQIWYIKPLYKRDGESRRHYPRIFAESECVWQLRLPVNEVVRTVKYCAGRIVIATIKVVDAGTRLRFYLQ